MSTMSTMNISLPEPMRAWVQAQIDNGQYAGNSDYICDLIRKDQAQKTKVQAMQAAITKGLESGVPQDFDKDAFKERMLDSLHDGELSITARG